MNGTFSNLVRGAGNMFNNIGKFGGQVGASLDNGVKNTTANFFGGGMGNQSKTPVDSPTPPGVTNDAASIKAGTYKAPTKPAAPTTASTNTGATSPTTATQPNNTFGNGTVIGANNGTSLPGQGSNYIDRGNSYSFAPSYVGEKDPGTSTYSKSVQNLANTSQGNPTSNAAASGLLGVAANGSPQIQQAIQNVKGLQNEQTEIANNPNLASEVASGRGQAISGLINSAQTGVQNALGQEGQQITAGTNAANVGLGEQSNQIGAQGNAGSLTQPVAGAAFFGSPTSGNTVGNGVGGSALVNTGVSQAVQQAMNGADPTSIKSQLVSQFGAPAGVAFDQAMSSASRGKYNPTAQSAIAQQNTSQGQAFQAKAADLNTNLTQMKNVTAPILSLLQKADINQQDVPAFNGSVNEYASQFLNPSNQASLKAGIAEIKTYVSNILGTGGDLTPTAITEMTNSFDPGNFTSQQLGDFLKNLDNYGQTRLQGFQQSSSGSYGGAQGYTGSQANPSSEATVSPNSPTSSVTATNPVAQGLIGGAMGALGGIEGMITGVASKILR